MLIAATTGSGKTWLLRALATTLSNRGASIVICDPKGSRWGALSPAVVRVQAANDFLEVLRSAHRELQRRSILLSQDKPVGSHVWAIFDEWILIRGKCSTLEASERAEAETLLLDIIAAGRELNIHLIIVNQSHYLGDLSLLGNKNTFSSGLRDNLCTLGLGCKHTYDNQGNSIRGNSKTIDSMLADPALVKRRDDRQKAMEAYADIRDRVNTNRVFCIYADQIYVGATPNIEIPELSSLQPFGRYTNR